MLDLTCLLLIAFAFSSPEGLVYKLYIGITVMDVVVLTTTLLMDVIASVVVIVVQPIV